MPTPIPKLESATPLPPDDFAQLEKKYLGAKTFGAKLEQWLNYLRFVSDEEKIFFTQNLAVMLTSGLAAAPALRTLTLQTSNSKFRQLLFTVTKRVERGEKIASAMSAYPKTFPAIFVNMIKTGEEAGQLEEVLAELTDQLKKSHALKQKVKGALAYPAAIVVAMAGIGTAMLTFVIPKLISIFKEMNVVLPLPTRLLIGLSEAINNHLLIFIVSGLALLSALTYFTRTPLGKKFLSALVLELPVLKKIAVKINLAKLARTLSSLLTTDIPIVTSLKLTSDTLKNTRYRASLLVLATAVEKGKTMSSEMRQFKKLYPPVVEQMIAVGEATGEMAKILKQLATFYEDDVSETMTALPSIIEPILIVLLGGAVAGMAVAVILPMFTLTQAV